MYAIHQRLQAAGLLASMSFALTCVSGARAGDDTPVPASPIPALGCGTDLTPEDVEILEQQQEAGLYDGLSGERVAGYHVVPVKVHIVRTSAGAFGAGTAYVENAIRRANEQLAAAHIFLLARSVIDYINNDDYYYNIDTQAEIDALRNVNSAPNMLNVYFTHNLYLNGSQLCGISTFTSTTASQGVVMSDLLQCTDYNSVLCHEIGHYFDLYHTHETAFGAECVDGTNCSTAGDRVCDTPADPGLHTCNPPGLGSCVDGACNYIGTAHDACHNQTYSPQTWNTMSYSRTACLTGYTSGQTSRALATLENIRPSHILTDVSSNRVFYVGTSFIGDGTWDFPYDTFAQARNAIGSGGGIIALAGDNENEGALTLNQPMTLIATGTVSVRLGAP